MDDNSQQSMDRSSFSRGWTLNKPFAVFLGDSGRSFDTLDGASFIEMDPHFLSRRWTIGSAGEDLGFDVDPRSSSSRLVLAEHIFAGGHLEPCTPTDQSEAAAAAAASSSSEVDDIPRSTLRTLLDQSRRRQAGGCFDSAPRRSTSSEYSNSPALFHSARSTPSAASSSRSLPSRASSSGGAGKELKSPPINNFMRSPRKVLLKYLHFLIPLYKKLIKGFRIRTSSRSQIRRSGATSARSTARTSSAFSSIEWCRSNADISIADAILYCKRSNGQYNKYMGLAEVRDES